jgi:hypothetical protein
METAMQSEQLVDARKISTGIAQRAVDRLIDFAEAKIKAKWAEHRNKTTNAFADYVANQNQRCSLVRTLIYDKQSAKLEDIYVPLSVSVVGHEDWRQTVALSDKEFSSLITQGPDEEGFCFSGFIVGPAGSGKSFLMRHLYLQICQGGVRQSACIH